MLFLSNLIVLSSLLPVWLKFMLIGKHALAVLSGPISVFMAGEMIQNIYLTGKRSQRTLRQIAIAASAPCVAVEWFERDADEGGSPRSVLLQQRSRLGYMP